MSTSEFLLDFIIFFAVTILFVPVFKRLKLGNIFGYLVAGIVVGPYGFGFIEGESNIYNLAEIGLIFLLFVIGQELSPRRLSALKSKIIIDGGLQFIMTILVTIIPLFWLTNNWVASFVISMAISLSSTAFVLSYLKDSKQLTLSYGQMAFSILLFQDMIIVPILTLLPFLGNQDTLNQLSPYSFLISISILLVSFLFLKFCLKPLMSFVQKESTEVFTAFCLLVIIGMAYIMESAGLSKALGAFIAGIYLSESEFKKDIETVVLPFKGMLMGVFFLTFGLRFNLDFFFSHMSTVIALCCAVLATKALVFYSLGYWRMVNSSRSKKLALLMCQGGEFGFVVLAMSFNYSIISQTQMDYLICALILSLFVAPVLTKFSETLFNLEEVHMEDHLYGVNSEEPVKDEESEIRLVS